MPVEAAGRDGAPFADPQPGPTVFLDLRLERTLLKPQERAPVRQLFHGELHLAGFQPGDVPLEDFVRLVGVPRLRFCSSFASGTGTTADNIAAVTSSRFSGMLIIQARRWGRSAVDLLLAIPVPGMRRICGSFQTESSTRLHTFLVC